MLNCLRSFFGARDSLLYTALLQPKVDGLCDQYNVFQDGKRIASLGIESPLTNNQAKWRHAFEKNCYAEQKPAQHRGSDMQLGFVLVDFVIFNSLYLGFYLTVSYYSYSFSGTRNQAKHQSYPNQKQKQSYPNIKVIVNAIKSYSIRITFLGTVQPWRLSLMLSATTTQASIWTALLPLRASQSHPRYSHSRSPLLLLAQQKCCQPWRSHEFVRPLEHRLGLRRPRRLEGPLWSRSRWPGLADPLMWPFPRSFFQSPVLSRYARSPDGLLSRACGNTKGQRGGLLGR